MGRKKKEKKVEEEEAVIEEPVVEEPEVVEEEPVLEEEAVAEEEPETVEIEPEAVEEAPKPVAKKPKANKFNAALNPNQTRRIHADTIKKRPVVSVEDMIEENKNSTVSTDYQRYLRKLMKQAGGR